MRDWEPALQSTIYGSPDSCLDHIMALGVNGVYLDRVDGYEYHEECEGRETAVREMFDFILDFTRYARERQPGYGVFPQDAEEPGIQFPDFLAGITGADVEGLYLGYPRDREASPAKWNAAQERILDQLVRREKLVLLIDYIAKPEQVADAYHRSLDVGYVEYVADRSLDRLRINPGFEPDRSPAEYDSSALTTE